MHARVFAIILLVVAVPLTGCVSEGADTASADIVPAAEGPGNLSRAAALPGEAVAFVEDPLAAGPLSFKAFDYDGGTTKVGGADASHEDYEYDARIRGRVWMPEGEGPFPFAVFLHGQHSTCQIQGEEAFFTIEDCSDDEGLQTPYPNHLGYTYLAEHLASHGYAVASMLNYEVNARNGNPDVGMWARGELILATLDAFRDGHEGIPDAAAGRIDFGRIGLMGHSRGGEGVVLATHVNLARPVESQHALMAIVALAPTDFNEFGVANIPLLSLVPLCDGDVYNLHGLRTYDHSRLLDDETPKVQLLVRGANHNFYNTRWGNTVAGPVANGDDAIPGRHFGAFCSLNREAGGGRLTSEETQRESIVHINGFLRWQIGGETGFDPYFTGEKGLPANACPAGTSACDGVVLATSVMPHATRILTVDDKVPTVNDVGGDVTVQGFAGASVCAQSSCGGNVYSAAPVLDLMWNGPATLTLAIPPSDADWSASTMLGMRVAVPTRGGANAAAPDFTVTLVDQSGGRTTVQASKFTHALEVPPDYATDILGIEAGSSKVTLNAIRIPLDAFGTDLLRVAAVEFAFDVTPRGRILLTDVLHQDA